MTWRKPVPALFDLSQDRSLPADFLIIAVDRVDLSDDTLRRRLHNGVKKFARHGTVKSGAWGEFARHLHYQQGNFKQLHTYATLREHCAKLEQEWGTKVGKTARGRSVFLVVTIREHGTKRLIDLLAHVPAQKGSEKL